MSTFLDYSVSTDFLIKVLVSSACGAALGTERQVKGKPPGLKTNILICIGCMAFTHEAFELSGLTRAADPTRVIGQIVTGIGFLGAGAIFAKDGLIVGLTSAAVVWVNAAIGSAIGLGRIGDAVVLTIITTVLIPIVRFFEFKGRNLLGGSGSHKHHQTSDSFPIRSRD